MRLPDGGSGGLDGGGDHADQPGVEGDTLGSGGLGGTGLQTLRQPNGGPAGGRVILVVHGSGRRLLLRGAVVGAADRGPGDGELDVSAPEAKVDRPRRQLAGDLGNRLGQRIQDGQPTGRLESHRQTLDDLGCLCTAHGGSVDQLPLELFYVG